MATSVLFLLIKQNYKIRKNVSTVKRYGTVRLVNKIKQNTIGKITAAIKYC